MLPRFSLWHCCAFQAFHFSFSKSKRLSTRGWTWSCLGGRFPIWRCTLRTNTSWWSSGWIPSGICVDYAKASTQRRSRVW